MLSGRELVGAVVIAAVGASLWLTDMDSALATLRSFTEIVRQMDSVRGAAVFLALHSLAVLVCFPATVLFELSAGFVFGLPNGVVLVVLGKLLGGGGGFLVGRFLLRSFIAGLLGKSGKGGTFARMAAGAEKDAWRAVFALRLSPVPSWLNTYGLASLTDVPITPFLVATAVGSIPMVVQNVYTGTLLDSISDLSTGSGQSWVSTAVMAMGVTATVYAGKLAMSYAAEEPGDVDGASRRKKDPSPKTKHKEKAS
jgi:uncharacterized membrane protein YdjX (TVP38/TMEM64 family)